MSPAACTWSWLWAHHTRTLSGSWLTPAASATSETASTTPITSTRTPKCAYRIMSPRAAADMPSRTTQRVLDVPDHPRSTPSTVRRNQTLRSVGEYLLAAREEDHHDGNDDQNGHEGYDDLPHSAHDGEGRPTRLAERLARSGSSRLSGERSGRPVIGPRRRAMACAAHLMSRADDCGGRARGRESSPHRSRWPMDLARGAREASGTSRGSGRHRS